MNFRWFNLFSIDKWEEQRGFVDTLGMRCKNQFSSLTLLLQFEIRYFDVYPKLMYSHIINFNYVVGPCENRTEMASEAALREYFVVVSRRNEFDTQKCYYIGSTIRFRNAIWFKFLISRVSCVVLVSAMPAVYALPSTQPLFFPVKSGLVKLWGVILSFVNGDPLVTCQRRGHHKTT